METDIRPFLIKIHVLIIARSASMSCSLQHTLHRLITPSLPSASDRAEMQKKTESGGHVEVTCSHHYRLVRSRLLGLLLLFPHEEIYGPSNAF